MLSPSSGFLPQSKNVYVVRLIGCRCKCESVKLSRVYHAVSPLTAGNNSIHPCNSELGKWEKWLDGRSSMDVVAVNPIEVVFFPTDYVVSKVHSGMSDGAVELAMSL